MSTAGIFRPTIRPLVAALIGIGFTPPQHLRPWLPCFLDREHFVVNYFGWTR